MREGRNPITPVRRDTSCHHFKEKKKRSRTYWKPDPLTLDPSPLRKGRGGIQFWKRLPRATLADLLFPGLFSGHPYGISSHGLRSFFIAALQFLDLSSQIVVLGHNVVPILYAVVEFLYEFVPLIGQFADGFILLFDAVVGFLQF
jgi:hypothetical protein